MSCFLWLLIIAGCESSQDGGDSNSNLSPEPQPVNHAPTISGTPAGAVTIDQNWSFTPAANDTDGDPLTFTIENQPDWASFDTVTGTLEGTPTLGDVSLYSGIRISVSDGLLSASTPQFSVDVTQVALGTAVLSWAAPTLYDDGQPLSNVTSLNIYYGVSQGNYPNQIEITNLGTTTHVVNNLVPDTYFFASTVVDSQGVESHLSNIVSLTVE